MRMRITDLAYQLFEKRWLDWQIYVPSGAEVNAPEQRATWYPELNFDLTIAVSDSNESPYQALHESYA